MIVLIVFNVCSNFSQEGDEGVYQCVVANQEDTAQGTAYLWLGGIYNEYWSIKKLSRGQSKI